MSDTPGRLLSLLSLLQTHREWPGTELSERLGVSPRTIRRDIERLRDLGYAVHATRGSAGGYRLTAGTATPPLLLDDDEAVAIAIGLRTAAGSSIAGIEETSLSALVKLEQMLPSRLRYRVSALHAAAVPLTPGLDGTINPGILTAIAAACRDQQRLRFAYCDRDGAATRRLTEPHRLVSAGRRWYLVAWDVDHADWRTFRVDRIQEPFATGVRFTARELPAKDAAAYLARALASWRPRYEAVVTLHVPAEVASSRIGQVEGRLEPIDERTCRLRLAAEDLYWLTIRLGMLGVELEVHDPPELTAQMRDLGQRLIRAAGDR